MQRPVGAVLVVLCCVLVLVSLAPVAATGGTAEITVEDSIDVPEQSIDDGKFTIDSIAVAEPGDEIVVDVTLPEDTTGYVELRNSDENVEDFERVEDSGTVTFSDEYKPGTYMFVLEIDGSFEAVHPLVVSGYDMSLSYPSEVEPDSSVTVTADLEYAAADDPPGGVEVIFHGNDEERDITADKIDEMTYEATLDLDGVDEGTYDLYAVATNDEEVEGYPVSLGVTAGHQLTIAEDDGDDSSPGDGEDDGSGDDETDNDESEDSTGDSDGDGETDDAEEQNGEEENANDETNDSDADSDDTDTDDSDETSGDDESDDADVIDPSDDTQGEPEDDDQSLSPIVPLVAILGAAFLGRRYRQR